MSARRKRSFDREFKLQVIRALVQGEKRISQLCREYDLSETLVRRWREQYERDGEAAWLERPAGHVALTPEQRVVELEAALGRAHLELELLRRALKKGGSPANNDGR